MMIDSNIVVYSFNKESPKHETAQKFLQDTNDLVFCHQNVFETLRIVTHSKFPIPIPLPKALKALHSIIKAGILLHPTSETQAIAFELIKKYNIIGNEVFDAYLVATSLSHGITQIATDNVKHLKKYQEIKVINPFITQQQPRIAGKLKHQLKTSPDFDDAIDLT